MQTSCQVPKSHRSCPRMALVSFNLLQCVLYITNSQSSTMFRFISVHHHTIECVVGDNYGRPM